MNNTFVLRVQADVDFVALKRVVESLPSDPAVSSSNKVEAFGPVTQGSFLFHMGIEVQAALSCSFLC